MISLYPWMEMKNIHNRIRNIPDAYQKLKEGVQHIKSIDPEFQDHSQNSDSSA